MDEKLVQFQMTNFKLLDLYLHSLMNKEIADYWYDESIVTMEELSIIILC
ncbi:unnamed protein product [Commensalibacter communis]|nr:hypothetical protein [Commensalibacter communis]CAI3935690.1 unnamed protein product [Commensalibacter communis]CAI3942522.1 unnamed protein product [Commensalibacter communis]CAI3944072.1 unnamed protein product [Commensalibacter communis]